MSYHNNRNNDTSSTKLDPAGEPVSLVQNQCYSSAAPTVQSLDTTVATITFNSNLEDIPAPTFATTNLVCTTKPDIFNKPQDFIDPVSGVVLQQSLLENFIGPGAVTHNLRIYGDAGAMFVFILKDITNNKTWDYWIHASNSNFPGDAQWRVNTAESAFSLPYAAPPAGAPGGPQNYIPVEFPGVSVNTTYHAFFKPVSLPNIYLDHLPTQASPWVINQLVDITFTANFLDGEIVGIVSGENMIADAGAPDTYNAAAGAILPTPANNGVWDVDITFTIDQEKGDLRFNTDRFNAFGSGLHNDVVTVDDIELPTTGDLPEILAINCVASITSSSGATKAGRILGTITLGNVGLTSQSLIFPVSQFFTVHP